jgi:hypothetical protein
MITVFVPKTYINSLNESGELPRPSDFWLSRPDSWMASDLATISVSPETWSKWTRVADHKNNDGKQLLKG